VGQARFAEFEYAALTDDDPQPYRRPVLSGPHALDLISRLLPLTVPGGPPFEVGAETPSRVMGLASELRIHANARPGDEPSRGENRFGRLMKGLGRGLLAVAGAGIAGTNAWVVITTGGVALPALGSMALGVSAIGAAVYNDPDILKHAVDAAGGRVSPSPSPQPVPPGPGGQVGYDPVTGDFIAGGVRVPYRRR
jgi:hypothetical protein